MLALIGALVCGALLVLLFLIVCRGEGRSVAFPAFSLAIESVSHEDAYLYYQVGEKKTEFYAAIGNGKTFFRASMVTTIPKEITDEDATEIAADLALGLSKLGYDYAIYRDGAVLARS
jgi:hypothetical protein